MFEAFKAQYVKDVWIIKRGGYEESFETPLEMTRSETFKNATDPESFGYSFWREVTKRRLWWNWKERTKVDPLSVLLSLATDSVKQNGTLSDRPHKTNVAVESESDYLMKQYSYIGQRLSDSSDNTTQG